MKSGNRRPLHLAPFVVLAMGFTLAGGEMGRAADAPPAALTPTSGLGLKYVNLADTVKQSDLEATIRALSAFPSRIPGYPGYERAAAYVEAQMRSAGLLDVRRESFTVATPVDHGATLTVNGRTFKVYPLWPNGVRTSRLPASGVSGSLVDGGNAKLSAFAGRPMRNSIVLLDFDSGSDWLNAPRLGAQAVIFVEPRQMLRGEAEAKWLQLPLSIPRYYIKRSDAAVVRALTRISYGGAIPDVQLRCNMRWMNSRAYNIVGKIEGSDPVLKKQVMVVSSFFDDMSTIPSIAPGSESASGIAAFLALARTYTRPGFRPARSVLFIADGAHCEALAGMRNYIEAHFSKPEGTIASLQGAPLGQRFRWWIGANSIWIFVVLAVIFGLGIFSAVQRLRGVSGNPDEGPHTPTRMDRVAFWIWVTLAAVCWVVLLILSPNHSFPVPAPIPPDNAERWYAFTALDLSSRNQQIGVFYKGMFYDMREDIQRNFSDFARSIRENVEKIAPLIGEDKDKNFADGVNPISGKSWRNYIPGKLALDHEPVTMAGGIGVGFVTTNDTRPYVDTPFDTVDRMRLANLTPQVKLLADVYYDIFNDSNKPDKNGEIKLPLQDASSFGRMTLQGGFGTLFGRTVQYIPTASFVPNTPVPGSLAILVNGNKTLTGVRGDDIQLVGQDGGFRFIGVAPLTAYGSNRDTNIQGYHLDESGDVDFAPDQGVNGATNYPITLQMTVAQKEATIVLFKCVGTSLYGMIDPQSMQLLTDLNLYDAQTDSSPQRYGVSAAKIESFQTHVEPAAMLFSERDTSIKVLMGAGPIATRLVMVNFTPWVPKFDSPVARSTIAELKSGKTPDEVAHAVEMLDPAKRTDDDTERLKVVHQYQMLHQWMIDNPEAPDTVFDVGERIPQMADQIRKSWEAADVNAWLFGPASLWQPLRNGSVKHSEDGDGYRVNFAPIVPASNTPELRNLATQLQAGRKSNQLAAGLNDTNDPGSVRRKFLTDYEAGRQWMTDHPKSPDVDFMVVSRSPNHVAAIRAAWKKADVNAWFFGPADIWGPLRNGSVTHNESGDGWIPRTSGTIEAVAYKVANDMYWLDNYRIDLLAKYRIINQGLDKLHKDTAREVVQASVAIRELNYDRFDSHARAGWGFESRAYPSVMETAQDVVKGVLFYLFLLLPFAYFGERLFFGRPDLRQQLAYGFAIFFVIFLILYEVHPAFEISKNPVIVLLAFVMLALGLMVISLVISKFEEQLKEYQKSVGGIHKADIGRMSVALAAFSLGISNMRKRPARTALTCTTLVLLTFTVLSFTSVVSDIHFNKIPAGEKPSYNGLLVRSPNWSEQQESAYETLYEEFGARRSVAPRAWFYSDQNSDQSYVTVGTNKNDNSYDARAVVGLAPQEKNVTHVDKAIAYGSWLQPFDPYTAIIPEGMAKALDLGPEDIGKAKVRFNGMELKLTGILSNAKFKEIKDLDGESLAPVDFIQMQRQQQQTGGGGQDQGQQGFQQYIHLEPDQMMIVPYQTLVDMGRGGLRSVAIDFVQPNEVTDVLDNLMPRLDMNLYAGIGNEVFRYSSIGSTSVGGLMDLLFPILIAACIVLNTMLGSVFERIKEIHIFSSIGLAPNHVAVLFLAESFVYSILGAVLGYVLGQSVTKLISHYDLLQGLSLNFSSISGVVSTCLVVAVVMLSTLYPARKASQVATPSIDRSWRVPDPVGDDWTIPMPFSVTGDQAVAMGHFLTEWFKAYEEYSIGDFVTQNVSTYTFDSEYGMAYSIKLMAWLAPFDLGVSQKVELQTVPTDMPDVYELRLVVHRESGDVSNWKRVNRRFLNTMRKQFLIWRTLSTSERERYLARHEDDVAPVPAI